MRSFFLRGLFVAAIAIGVAACSAASTTSSDTVPVTLANAQQESKALLTVVTLLAGSNPSPAIAADLKVANDAVTAFDAITPGTSAVQQAETVINDLEPILALIPIPGVSGPAVDAGITLIEGLINGVSAVGAPAPSATLGAAPVKIITAPIPIPLPVS